MKRIPGTQRLGGKGRRPFYLRRAATDFTVSRTSRVSYALLIGLTLCAAVNAGGSGAQATQQASGQLAIVSSVQSLQDPDPRRRAAALETLVREGAAAERDVRALLKHGQPAVRIAALKFFQQVVVATAFSDVAGGIKDPEPSVRATAARTLSAYPARMAIPVLLDSVKDTDVSVRVNATSALAVLGNRDVIPLLRQAARSAANPAGERQSAMLSLGQLRASESIDELFAIGNSDSEADKTRGAAVLALAQMDVSDQSRYLGFFKDRSGVVRFNAAHGAALIGGANAEASLTALLRSQNEEDFVRVRAAASLAILGTSSAVAELLRCAREEREFIAMHAVRILLERRIEGGREAGATLRARSKDSFVESALDSFLRSNK